MAATHSPYLLYDDYIRHRNIQDQQLNTEFKLLREDVDERFQHVDERFGEIDQRLDNIDADIVEIKADIVEIKADIVEIKTDIVDIKADIVAMKADIVEIKADIVVMKADIVVMKADIVEMKADIVEMKLDQRQFMAQIRNGKLRNPTMRIHPVPILGPTGSIIDPDLDLFPRHAREFYQLRTPRSARQLAKLQYLVEFYDVAVPETAESIGSDSGSDSGLDSDAMSVQDRHHVAVDMLEGILGLAEHKFLSFMEKAREHAQRARESQAAKRASASAPANEPPASRPFWPKDNELPSGLPEEFLSISRVRVSDDPNMPSLSQLMRGGPKSETSSKPSFVIGWRECSTPPMRMASREKQQDAGGKPESAGQKSAGAASAKDMSEVPTEVATASPTSERLRRAGQP